MESKSYCFLTRHSPVRLAQAGPGLVRKVFGSNSGAMSNSYTEMNQHPDIMAQNLGQHLVDLGRRSPQDAATRVPRYSAGGFP